MLLGLYSLLTCLEKLVHFAVDLNAIDKCIDGSNADLGGKLQYLTKERLPNSLSSLDVYYCPLSEHRWQFGKGQDWEYIADIPRIIINHVY